VVIVILITSLPFIFRRSRGASFGVAFFFLALLPVSNIVPLRALMAERFLYLPSIGFCILISILLEKVSRMEHSVIKLSFRKFAIITASLLILLYSVRKMMRNEDWKSQIAVTNSILKIDPLNQWALTTLGVAYSDRGQYEMAIKPLIKAIILSKDYFAPRSVLGFCYVELGRYDEAIRILTDALKIKPDNLEALSSLGVAYAQTKRYPEAIEQFEHTIKADPSFVDGYMNLATTYDQMGESDKAIQTYKRAASSTRSAQSIAIAYVRIGDVYRKLSDLEKARAYYNKALSLPNYGMVELKKLIEDRLKSC
jgi:tetratricopeptide (TPR) repeat protein